MPQRNRVRAGPCAGGIPKRRKGRLFWGFNADWDAVPDLHELVAAIDAEFRLLEAAALPASGQQLPANGTTGRQQRSLSW
jgi:hypothetical protein